MSSARLVWAAACAALLGTGPAQHIPAQTWLSAAVGGAPAEGVLTRHAKHTAASWTHCVALGALLKWPQLVCYTRPVCHLWWGRNVALADVSRNGTNSGVCKVVSDFTGCFKMDFSLARIGETNPNPTCVNINDVCEDGGFVIQPPVLKDVCDGPYEWHDIVGCIYIVQEYITWCEGRKACLEADGDLYFVTSEQEYQGLVDYLRQQTEYHSFTSWMGLWYQNEEWVWLHSNYTPSPDAWESPPASGQVVAGFRISPQPKLVAATLDTKTLPVCRRLV